MLITKLFDGRRAKPAQVCIFAPVGDPKHFRTFQAQIKRLGLEDVDFLFIFKQGIDIVIDSTLSAMYYVETCPIGTSGCFFAGQRLLYDLGYETIVSTDLDAELDNANTLRTLVELATDNAVFSQSKFPGNTSKQLAYNVNDWAAYPRKFFEDAGFSTPYMWRGGEEYELLSRIRKSHRFIVAHGGYTHPFAGFSIYHKLADRKKYCPYIAGILRAILFVSEYDIKALPKFMLWYTFYGFFADLLNDPTLKRVLATAGTFKLLRKVEDAPYSITITKVKNTAEFSNTSPFRVAYLPISLLSLALTGKCTVYTDRVACRVSRVALVKATVMAPIRAIESVLRIIEWKLNRKKFPFPPTPQNADLVEEAFYKLITDK